MISRSNTQLIIVGVVGQRIINRVTLFLLNQLTRDNAENYKTYFNIVQG